MSLENTKRILIVEDNKDLSEIYRIAFEQEGFEIKLSENGMNAISLLSTFHPDVVLLDIMMPFVSGFDFLKIVRSKGNHVKIFINSNLSQEADIQKAKELGADEYFRKDELTPLELVKKVCSYIN